ncbi:MAG: D-glycero-beta-D-manno-heptose-7-phosphate kinase [Chitinispirillaceae bacterium]|nr:D-glycero-beta-D-manno-heptose-7-phosphate kinase [Chitinispirillaceae bacterium]
MELKAPSLRQLKSIVKKFSSSNMIVVGDTMIDEYFWGDVQRISPEAPVPVVAVESVTRRLGGAANVVQNLVRLGVNTSLLSLCGNDENGRLLLEMLSEAKCDTSGVHQSPNRPTSIKTRIIARQQQVVRADREKIGDLDDDENAALIAAFNREIVQADGVIISDYGKGVISPEFITPIIEKCNADGKFIAIDPKDRHMHLYKGASIITPNLKEAHVLLGRPYHHCSDREVEQLGWQIIDDYNLQYLLITLSERGMALFEKENRRFRHLPTVAQKVFDVTGAGDTVISVFSAAITAGSSPFEAAYLANHAAGITVAQLGTASVTPEELLAACG